MRSYQHALSNLPPRSWTVTWQHGMTHDRCISLLVAVQHVTAGDAYERGGNAYKFRYRARGNTRAIIVERA
jgi:hypothetical protein